MLAGGASPGAAFSRPSFGGERPSSARGPATVMNSSHARVPKSSSSGSSRPATSSGILSIGSPVKMKDGTRSRTMSASTAGSGQNSVGEEEIPYPLSKGMKVIGL